MALTLSNTKRYANGNVWNFTGTVTIGTYATGGLALTPASVGMRSFDSVDVDNISGYEFSFDYTNNKILVYNPGGAGAHTHDLKIIGSQAAAGTDAVSAKTLTLGKEAATDITIAGANSATLGGVVASTASVAAATEVANAVDLSAVVTRFRIRGT